MIRLILSWLRRRSIAADLDASLSRRKQLRKQGLVEVGGYVRRRG